MDLITELELPAQQTPVALFPLFYKQGKIYQNTSTISIWVYLSTQLRSLTHSQFSPGRSFRMDRCTNLYNAFRMVSSFHLVKIQKTLGSLPGPPAIFITPIFIDKNEGHWWLPMGEQPMILALGSPYKLKIQRDNRNSKPYQFCGILSAPALGCSPWDWEQQRPGIAAQFPYFSSYWNSINENEDEPIPFI